MKLRRVLCAALIVWTLLSVDEINAFRSIKEFGDIAMWDSVRDYPDTEGGRGYAMRRFKIQNRSTNKTYRVTLRLPYDKMSGKIANMRLSGISKTIEMPPSSLKCVTLFQPALPLYGYECAVYINGKRQQEPVVPIARLADHGAVFSSASSSAGGALIGSSASFQPKVFMTSVNSSFPEKALSRKAAAFISRSTGGSGKSMSLPEFINASSFDVRFRRGMRRADETSLLANNNFEPSWLNYSPLEGVVYNDFYVEDMTPSARLALLRYVECGGTLTLFVDGMFKRTGGREMSDSLKSFDRRLKNRRVFGDTYEQFDAGFGVIHLVGQEMETRQISDAAVAVPESWYEAERAWNRLHTASGANKVLPMARPPDSRSSFISLFILMLILAVLIGPAHLLILKRMNRREWVYWTTPAVSILACGAFALYALIAFGWSRQTRVVSLTHLDQGAGRAATIGWAAYYSPLTSSAELRFDENTELTPLAFGESLVGSIDWTGGQRLTGGWLPARVPRHFKLRKNEDRPERIDLKRDGGALKIVNRLGARVKSLWYADHDGAVYSAVDISNGAEAVLTETKGVHIGMKKLRDVYASQDWVAEIEAAQKSPAAYLQPGRYFAELEENVFVEKALKGAKIKPSTCLVLGVMEYVK